MPKNVMKVPMIKSGNTTRGVVLERMRIQLQVAYLQKRLQAAVETICRAVGVTVCASSKAFVSMLKNMEMLPIKTGMARRTLRVRASFRSAARRRDKAARTSVGIPAPWFNIIS